jgi:outer membrane protein assembly factor BamB
MKYTSTRRQKNHNPHHRVQVNPENRVIMYFISFLLIFSVAIPVSTAQKNNEWTGFHGPDRTNKSAETGLLKEWPQNGPRLLMTISGLGEGYSGVSIADGLIYTAGSVNDQTHVFAFDLNGKLVWKKPNGRAWSTTASWASSYTGSRSTPACDNGIVFHLGEMGLLTAYNAKSGVVVWSKDIAADFGASRTEYGYSESVLIDGDYLYTRPAGKKGFVVCLNKVNGNLVWANKEIPGSEGYSSLIIHEYGGYRQIIGSSSNCYFGLDSKSGRLLWRVDFANQRELNITDAVASNENILISSGYGKGSMMFRLRSSGKDFIPETVWQTKLMDNHHGGIILHEGYIYGSGTNSVGWFCLDFMTGKQMWRSNGKGSLTYADGMLYLLDEKGNMKLVKASPGKYEQHGEFRVSSGGMGPYWAHPVVCGGRLYVRHTDKLFVYDISKDS